MSLKDVVGEAHYFDETVDGAKIRKLLDNVDLSGQGAVLEKTEGMKYLLAVRRRARATRRVGGGGSRRIPAAGDPGCAGCCAACRLVLRRE
jgi:hypothetical protein